MKKAKTKIISICIIVAVCFSTFGVTFKIYKYSQARDLCELIEAGEEIHTDFSNGTTAPRFLIHVTNIMQVQGPRIPLVQACYFGNVQAVEILLDNGADPNDCFDGHWSALEAAYVGFAYERRFEIIKMLVEHGADVNHFSGLREPLAIKLARSISLGNDSKEIREILVYLAENGADKSCTNEYGNTAYYYALNTDDKELQEILKP